MVGVRDVSRPKLSGSLITVQEDLARSIDPRNPFTFSHQDRLLPGPDDNLLPEIYLRKVAFGFYRPQVSWDPTRRM